MVSVVSVLLVVGVALAVVVVVHHHGDGKKDGITPSSSTKSIVDSVCSNTDYKEACQKTLSPLSHNATADYKEIIKAAVQATVDQVNKSLNLTESLLVEANNSNSSRLKMSLEDCNDLLSLAISQLQASFSMVGDSDMHTIKDRSAELKSWLSSVISYAETCIDGVEEPKFQGQLKDTLQDATALTDNALAIVSTISDLLAAIGMKLNPKALINGRRLLEETVIENDGLPTWFSASDRKLMALHDNGRIAPNVVVAKDGSGQFKSIAAALASYPKNHAGRYVIYVKAGVYDEYITVEKSMVNIFMYGDGPRKTIVTGRKSYTGGFSTFRTASFSAVGAGFVCKGMGFQNTAGPEGHQAVALRVQSEMSAFFNCRMDGYQDTLYVQAGRQFYRNCVISGTIDFIFGDGTVVIQNSLLIVRRPMDNQLNAVTAQGRKERHQPTGIVIHNCRIVPEQKLFPDRFKIPTYLGRPWKEFSRTIIMETTLADFIQPTGWFPWAGDFALNTLYYAEYANRGPGSRTNQRVHWRGYHVIGRNEAQQFTVAQFLEGHRWLPATGAPFLSSFKR